MPVLLRLAEEMEVSRDHVLGKPHRESGWSDELLEQANRTQNEPDDLPAYESIGASAELDSLIFDGSTYGTPTQAGSAEEQDFLGLPGLLDADQVRTLLAKRQSDQLDARDAEEKARRAEDRKARERAEVLGEPVRHPAADTRATAEPATAADELPQLRKELNARVAIAASKTGRPHGAIHTEVRKACGGPPTALCNAEQLRQRIAFLRDW